MKKFGIYFFLFFYILGFTDARELMKIPVFFSHYLHHSEYHGTDFVSFFEEHYLAAQPDSAHEQDSQLPFKSAENISTNTVSITEPAYDFCRIAFSSLSQQKIPLKNDSILGNGFSSSIWQPPKGC